MEIDEFNFRYEGWDQDKQHHNKGRRHCSISSSLNFEHGLMSVATRDSFSDDTVTKTMIIQIDEADDDESGSHDSEIDRIKEKSIRSNDGN